MGSKLLLISLDCSMNCMGPNLGFLWVFPLGLCSNRLGEFYGYVCGMVVPLWGLGRINVGISLGAFDAILMGVFWVKSEIGSWICGYVVR
jgi:ABC-type multidrug transport system permease subunit